MSKESLEHVYSLMDGEMSADSGMFLTRRLASDQVLSATWERYHLIRDCIRKPGSTHVVSGFSARLSIALDAEQVATAPAWRSNRWLKPVSGVAIAASVALMAIVVTGPQPGISTGVNGEASVAETPNQPFVSPNTLPLAPVSQAASYTPTKRSETDRLNAYLLRHNQMAGTAGRQGFVSFVPIVAIRTSTGNSAEATAEYGQKQDIAESTTEQDAAANR